MKTHSPFQISLSPRVDFAHIEYQLCTEQKHVKFPLPLQIVTAIWRWSAYMSTASYLTYRQSILIRLFLHVMNTKLATLLIPLFSCNSPALSSLHFLNICQKNVVVLLWCEYPASVFGVTFSRYLH